MSGETAFLFRVSNHHSEDCGVPPQVNGDAPRRYVGYFKNQHGEQAIFIYDYMARTATVWLGDAGWEEGYRVVEGRAPGLILDDAEQTWLMACWMAAKP